MAQGDDQDDAAVGAASWWLFTARDKLCLQIRSLLNRRLTHQEVDELVNGLLKTLVDSEAGDVDLRATMHAMIAEVRMAVPSVDQLDALRLIESVTRFKHDEDDSYGLH